MCGRAAQRSLTDQSGSGTLWPPSEITNQLKKAPSGAQRLSRGCEGGGVASRPHNWAQASLDSQVSPFVPASPPTRNNDSAQQADKKQLHALCLSNWVIWSLYNLFGCLFCAHGDTQSWLWTFVFAVTPKNVITFMITALLACNHLELSAVKPEIFSINQFILQKNDNNFL